MLAGPHSPLPPLNSTRSAPASAKAHRFSTGGSCAAASTISGDVPGARHVGHCLERERARGEVRPGHVQDARRPRADRSQQVRLGRSACGPDLDEPPAGKLHRRVIRDPVAGLDEEVAREPVELVGPE